MKFTIYELQNLNSVRDGELINVKSLISAKRYATKNQVWQGTVLRVCDESGHIISTKCNDGEWDDENRNS